MTYDEAFVLLAEWEMDGLPDYYRPGVEQKVREWLNARGKLQISPSICPECGQWPNMGHVRGCSEPSSPTRHRTQEVK